MSKLNMITVNLNDIEDSKVTEYATNALWVGRPESELRSIYAALTKMVDAGTGGAFEMRNMLGLYGLTLGFNFAE